MIEEPLRIGIVGVGKMGISHLAIFRAHPTVEVVGVCDSSRILTGVLNRYTGVDTYSTLDEMIREAHLDAVVIATPTTSHFPLVSKALSAGLHVFCEKPLTLSHDQSIQLRDMARENNVHTQVGYHNRFVASFRECQRLLSQGAIGKVTHAHAQAEGPVVLRKQGDNWRSRRDQGGSCLYDYAAHPIDLLNWYFGPPSQVAGTVLTPIFSSSTDDAVHATVRYAQGVTAHLAVNWSDESQRKMSTQLTIWGTSGKISVDRQALKVYLRSGSPALDGYREGWNIKYTTDLTDPGFFYLRGEEYSEQVDHFVRNCMKQPSERAGINTFEEAAKADRVMDMLLKDAADDSWTHGKTEVLDTPLSVSSPPRASGHHRLRHLLELPQALTSRKKRK